MNPYIYQKRGMEQDSKPAFSLGAWVLTVFTKPIGSVMALAFVFFTAGSVMAMALAAAPEVAAVNDNIVLVQPVHLPPKPASAVLGDSTTATVVIDDSALEATDPTASLTAKAVSFDAAIGRWNYDISYSVSGLTGSATLSIGTYVVQSSITASGDIQTGAILKPSTTYHVSLYAQDTVGIIQVLAHINIKTGKAGKSSTSGSSACVFPLTGTNTSGTPPAVPMFCIKDDSGKLNCMPGSCMPQLPISLNVTGMSSMATTTTSTPPGTWLVHMQPGGSSSAPPTSQPPMMPGSQ